MPRSHKKKTAPTPYKSAGPRSRQFPRLRPKNLGRHPGRAYPKPKGKLVPSTGATFGRRPSKIVGPPRVGMRTVRGRGGKPVTVKSPSPRYA